MLAAKKRVTLRDIAAEAGCSVAVVSTVVNGSVGNTLVSVKTRDRVLQAATRLRYRPNHASRSLMRRSTRTIGVYVPPDPWAGIGLGYESAIVQGIEQACRSVGYDLLAINLSGGQTAEECADKFAEQRIDGLVLLHVDHTADWIPSILEQSPKVVAVNYYGDAPVDRVNFDDRAAGRAAVEYLLKAGHRRIGYFSHHNAWYGPGNDLRLTGVRDGLRDAGLALPDRWIWDFSAAHIDPSTRTSTPDASIAGSQYFASLGDERPTAVVAYSDPLALRAMRRMQAMGLCLPKDLSVVGIDGSEMGELAWPPLTSVVQPFAELGRRAALMCITKSNEGHGAPVIVSGSATSAPQVLERESVRRIN